MYDGRISKTIKVARKGKIGKGGRKASRPRKRLSKMDTVNSAMNALGGGGV